MKNILISAIVATTFYSCICTENNSKKTPLNQNNVLKDSSLINTQGTTIESRFMVPKLFERVQLETTSFGYYLRKLPLKPHHQKVKLYNGEFKGNQSAHIAVVDQDLDAVNLQQCADAVMRLRGEFLFQQKRYDDIHFNFLSDEKPRYFIDFASGDLSYKKFRAYMRNIFSSANTASLKNELTPIAIKDIQVGDVFIQSGNPYGHAVIVVDVAKNNNGERLFLLAQSYMPAQETHVLKNPNNSKLSPWYKAQTGNIQTPEWKFNSSDLRRFAD